MIGAWIDRLERVRSRQPDHYVDVAGARLRIRIAGQGSPTIVLAPDPPNVIEHLSALVDELSKTHRVVCVELPSFGFSSGTARDQPRILGALLEQLDLGPYALALPCCAGLVSAQLAAKHRAIVSHVIGVQSAGLGGVKAWLTKIDRKRILRRAGLGQALVLATRKRTARGWYDLAVAEPDQRAGYVAIANRAFDRGATFPLASALQMLDHAVAPPPIVQPTLLVWGARDPTHRKTVRDELSPGARVVTLPTAGHFPELEDVAGFCAAVRAFTSS